MVYTVHVLNRIGDLVLCLLDLTYNVRTNRPDSIAERVS